MLLINNILSVNFHLQTQVKVIVQQISLKFWRLCALCDKSVKLCTVFLHTNIVIFRQNNQLDLIINHRIMGVLSFLIKILLILYSSNSMEEILSKIINYYGVSRVAAMTIIYLCNIISSCDAFVHIMEITHCIVHTHPPLYSCAWCVVHHRLWWLCFALQVM